MNIAPVDFLALDGPDQTTAVLKAKDTLELVAKAAGKDRRIEKMVDVVVPRVPELLSVLRHRRILEVLDPPDAFAGVAVSAAGSKEIVRVGARVLGPGNNLVAGARTSGVKRSRVARVEDGAHALSEGTKIIVDRSVRKQAKIGCDDLHQIAANERTEVDAEAKGRETVLRAGVENHLRRFDAEAEAAFKDLAPGVEKSKLIDIVIKKYQGDNARDRCNAIALNPHFLGMLLHACPEATWTHNVDPDMEKIVDGGVLVRHRVVDILIHAEPLDLTGEKQFTAGGKVWHVHYCKQKGTDSRIFFANAVGAENDERVILWYGVGKEIPHKNAGYLKTLEIRKTSFIRQMGG